MSDESEAAERVMVEAEIEHRVADIRRQMEALRPRVEAAEERYGEEAVREHRALLDRMEKRLEELEA